MMRRYALNNLNGYKTFVLQSLPFYQKQQNNVLAYIYNFRNFSVDAPVQRIIGSFGDSFILPEEPGTSRNAVPLSDKYIAQFQRVKRILIERNAFTRDVIEAHALTYYNDLGLNEYYFQTASPQTIANNLGCVIAAKILNEASASDFFPLIHQELEGETFWMARASIQNRKASQNYAVERELEAKYLGLSGNGESVPWRMQCYRSVASIFDDPENYLERLRTYFLQKPEYPEIQTDLNETDTSKLLDRYFFAHKKGTSTEQIYYDLNAKVVNDSTGQRIFMNSESRGDAGHRLDFAFRRSSTCADFFSRLGDCVTMVGCYSQRKYVEPLNNGVTIVTIFVNELPEPEQFKNDLTLKQRAERIMKLVSMQYILPRTRFTDLAQERKLTLHESAYAYSVFNFIEHFSGTVGPAFSSIEKMVRKFGGPINISQQELYEVRTRLKAPPYSEDSVFRAVTLHPDIVKRLYQEFREMHHPNAYASKSGKLNEWQENSQLAIDINSIDTVDAIPIFKMFQIFNKSILKTNFWKDSRLALAFRLKPDFLPRYDYPDRPYGIVFTVGSQFIGFHVRFADVARGGVRIVLSYGTQEYDNNRKRIFDEAYKLANTQHFKNKDIPEGGSKGVVLINKTESRAQAESILRVAFKGYIDSMLDLLLKDPRVVDRLGSEELYFLGPDENTGNNCLMDWAAEHARKRNAWFWKAFTTGKLPQMGGIPHDTYGMTTASVETYVKGILDKLGLEESSITKFLIGGPDGDLGCNSMLQSDMKTTTIVDGSGVLHDPNGLNKSELHRLAQRRLDGQKTSAMMYDDSLLSAMGFKVPQDAKNVRLPDGNLISGASHFRNTFHLNPIAFADLFNPCGGRPESITPFNVDKMFMKDGTPRFKFIVEGANVFITADARRLLESRGVILFKDASTNKGGVTSSSFEVLVSLALNDEEFEKHMRLLDPTKPPQFYKDYVFDVLERIKKNAQLEFEALWREGLRTGKPRCDLTDILSAKIINLKNNILESGFSWEDEQLVNLVLSKAVPDPLVPGLLSVSEIRSRVPEVYMKAVFSTYLSSRFFYATNFSDDVSALAFSQYIHKLKSGAVLL